MIVELKPARLDGFMIVVPSLVDGTDFHFHVDPMTLPKGLPQLETAMDVAKDIARSMGADQIYESVSNA